MYYLNDLHPEVFAASPRPGGIAKIQRPDLRAAVTTSSRNIQSKASKGTLRPASRKSSKVTIKTTTTVGTFDKLLRSTTPSAAPKRTTREYRIKKILSSSPWLLFDDEDEPDNVLPPDPVHDAMTILATSISTIMLMAANYKNIPREHLVWTQSYLECVRDDYGNTPPNARGIMNNIKLIDNTLISFFDELDEDTKSELTGGAVIKAPIEVPASTPAEQPAEAEGAA